jgi:glutamate racemase
VERGVTSGRQVLGLAQGYLEPLQQADVDTVVLGCTHYPLLTGVLQIVMGPSVTLVSSAEETAKDVVRVLTERDLLAEPDSAGSDGAEPDTDVRHELVATGPATPFVRLAKRFLGPELGAVVAATP